MWITYAIITFILWGVADLFYKIGNRGKEETNHLKTGIFVGLVLNIYPQFFKGTEGPNQYGEEPA